VDVAYRLRLDHWQGQERLQLELVALRPSAGEVVLQRRNRTYWCRRQGADLVIRNAAGEELRRGLDSPDHPYVRSLVLEAAMALGMAC
jgi:single-stranded-DNA-specific exonuclease